MAKRADTFVLEIDKKSRIETFPIDMLAIFNASLSCNDILSIEGQNVGCEIDFATFNSLEMFSTSFV